MTVVQYEQPAPLPPSKPGDELAAGPTGDVARLRAAAEYAAYVAGTEFVPEALRDRPAAVAAAMLAGAEVGLQPMASLRMVAIIKGKPTLTAEAQRGLVAARGHELWFEESTTTRAIAAGRRAGSERVGRVTWTLDDAKRAGIAGQPNWRSYPAEMLRARASAALARAMFADVTLGIPAIEELDDELENGPPPAGDLPPVPGDVEPAPKATRTRKRAPRAAAAQPVTPPPAPEEPKQAARPPVTPTPPPDPQPEPPMPGEPGITEAQRRQLFALMRDLGVGTREERLAVCGAIVGHEIASSDELTLAEASTVIDALVARKEGGDRGDVAPSTAAAEPGDPAAAPAADDPGEGHERPPPVPYNEFPDGF